jgi:hypothetical protein
MNLEDAEAFLDGILDDQDDLIDQATGFGFKAAVLDLSKAEAFLDGILEDQDDLINQATDFGFKAAARSLMPLAEAKVIVDGFDKNTEKLTAFLNSLYNNVRYGDIPADLKADYEKLTAKANKALDKFNKDRAKAQKALDAWEDKLVGDNFQKMFQAIRLRIVKLDPQHKVKFTTNVYLDKTPAYAVGTTTLYDSSGELAYTIHAGYKAEGDAYWANLHSHLKNHTFRHVVEKAGHTKVSRFATDLVDQLEALAASEDRGVFTPSRRKAPTLTLRTPAEIGKNLKGPITQSLKRRKNLQKRGGGWRLTQQGSDFELSAPASGWTGKNFDRDVIKNMISMTLRTEVKPLLREFKVQGWSDSKTYVVTPKLKKLEFTSPIGTSPYNFASTKTFSDIKGFDALILENRPWWAPRVPIRKVKAIAATLKVYAPTTEGLLRKLREMYPYPDALYGAYEITFSVKVAKGASIKVAGGCGFDHVVWVSDVNRAYREGVEEQRAELGEHEGYGGGLHNKDGYKIKSKDPVTLNEAYAASERDLDRNDKWGPAYARALTNPKVMSKKQVTVAVKARNEREALRKGVLLIEATGRIAPRTEPVVEKPVAKAIGGGSRVKEWEVTGLRKLVKAGGIDGWLFYGIAPC